MVGVVVTLLEGVGVDAGSLVLVKAELCRDTSPVLGLVELLELEVVARRQNRGSKVCVGSVEVLVEKLFGLLESEGSVASTLGDLRLSQEVHADVLHGVYGNVGHVLSCRVLESESGVVKERSRCPLESGKISVGNRTNIRKESSVHNVLGDCVTGGEHLGGCCRCNRVSGGRDGPGNQVELSSIDLSLAREHVAGEVRVSKGVTESRSNPDSQVSGGGHSKLRVLVDVGLILSAEIVSTGTVRRLEGSECDSLSLGRNIEVVGSVDNVSVHKVLEILGVHLVSDLRERLPSLQEGRQVVHLPPEVEAFVVQSRDFSVGVKCVLEIVVLLVNNFVGARSGSVDHSIDSTLDYNLVGLSSELVEMIGNDLSFVFTILYPLEHILDSMRVEEFLGVVVDGQVTLVSGLEESGN